jgi:hypothetical protein
MNAKRRMKKCWILSELCEKIWFFPPFWFQPPFLTHLTKYALDLCCLPKCKRIMENIGKFLNNATLNFGRLIGHQTRSWIWQKSFLLWNIPDWNTSSNQKRERKKVQKSLSYGRKIKFSAILKITAILKTCEKNFPIFFQIFKHSYL